MPEWLTVTEAAKLSGYHPNHVRRLIRAGAIRAEQWATIWRVDKKSVLAYVKSASKKGEKRGPKTTP